ncbi:MAG: hypothetical protein Greene071421_118 [Parcubacteria group bacterium Greene0714_21]|nr:MAG: hypothetical protein Greene041639_233 [Parcubacteria group bacterium Greene0416_39]TSC98521.1 MAG: hypothetical protein Greene101447_23 [Parcubacteria group bacterium Greene1014_47]TSD04282.1 MAG: hypothetical protein Greene071421_118 [Parcubacteria group bacterium Greene0714_21]
MIFSIAFEYVVWHFAQMPLEIAKAWRNILLFNLEYFSLPVLLKTLFAPWRKIQFAAGKGFNIAKLLEAAASNLISRILGALIRSVLIIAGLATEAALLATALATLIAWFLLPIAIVLGFSYGFSTL